MGPATQRLIRPLRASSCHSPWTIPCADPRRVGCPEQEMIQWGPPLGLPLSDWFDCSDKRGQPTCPPLQPHRTDPVAAAEVQPQHLL